MEGISQLEDGNRATVESLYEALSAGDSDTVVALLAPDLEWWFHGPPRCHHMMKVLTGEAAPGDYRFEPRRVSAIANRVVAEGWAEGGEYWVHVWTLKDGVITQFREYFNTVLTVRELGRPVGRRWPGGRPLPPTVWQSDAGLGLNRSLPGLVLAL